MNARTLLVLCLSVSAAAVVATLVAWALDAPSSAAIGGAVAGAVTGTVAVQTSRRQDGGACDDDAGATG